MSTEIRHVSTLDDMEIREFASAVAQAAMREARARNLSGLADGRTQDLFRVIEDTICREWCRPQFDGLYDRAVRSLGLNPKLNRILHDEKVDYVGELVQVTEYRLRRIPGIGRKSVEEVRVALANLGEHLTLGTRLPGWRRPDDEARRWFAFSRCEP